MTTRYDAIILGGGHNGLVAAIYLSKARLKVLVVERRPFVGGACATEELFPGYRFSSCSYFCHMLQERIIKELELRKFGFEVFSLDCLGVAVFPDGRSFIYWNDPKLTAKEISKISPKDETAYLRWAQFWSKAAGLLHYYFFRSAPSLRELSQRARETDTEDILEILLTWTLEDLLEEYFSDENVKGALANYAQDLGDPSAVGSLLSAAYIHVQDLTSPENFGIVKGGMGGITQSMERAAISIGVEILKGAEVERIIVRENRVLGVRLSDNKEIDSPIVVSNADPKRTFLRLLGEDSLPSGFKRKAEQLKTRVSYLKFHAALRALPDFRRKYGNFDAKLLSNVWICPSIDHVRKSWDDAMHGRPSRSPIIHVQIPTVVDPSMAPPGMHTMSMWVQYAPPRLNEGSWDDIRQAEGEFLIETLSHYAPNLSDVISQWSLFTPLDLERRVSLTDGNIRHLDMIPSQMLSLRPSHKTPITGLYLCGAGTHPGGEVTGAPGYNAAASVLSDYPSLKK